MPGNTGTYVCSAQMFDSFKEKGPNVRLYIRKECPTCSKWKDKNIKATHLLNSTVKKKMKRKEEEKTQVTVNVFRLIEKRKPSKGEIKSEIKRKKF